MNSKRIRDLGKRDRVPNAIDDKTALNIKVDVICYFHHIETTGAQKIHDRTGSTRHPAAIEHIQLNLIAFVYELIGCIDVGVDRRRQQKTLDKEIPHNGHAERQGDDAGVPEGRGDRSAMWPLKYQDSSRIGRCVR